MAVTIALAGNPNSGKTTLFNALTGANQYVGNWPGVTVEKKEGKLKGNNDVIIQDLPGIYSLSPYTLEEVVSRNYLVNERPDAILNIVDGTNIERNLYLTTQLAELGIPVVLAVNMMDLVKKNGDMVDVQKIGKEIGCEAVEISALKGQGIDKAAELAVKAAESKNSNTPHAVFGEAVEKALNRIEEALKGKVEDHLLRWYAVKVFERDEKVMEKLDLGTEAEPLEKVIESCERELDDDSESIITNERYSYITNITEAAVKKARTEDNLTISDRIDRIVTNRILGLPIFAVIMFLVYAIAMGGWKVSIGTAATDFTNDVIFGEWVPGAVDSILSALGVAEETWLYGLIQNGIVAGVGAVLGFVPQMLVLFVLLAILEDIGYMSRVAFVMDRIFRQFGLSGKSFIPCLVATGCGIPGVMASRTIEQDRDRKLTVMTTTFMPCGAKLPIIGLIAGSVFGESPFVAASAYFIGIGSIILSGIILKKFKAFAGEPAPFVMELPAYHVPSLGNVLRATWERGWSFIKRAGSVIVISSIILWFLQGFGTVNGQFGMVKEKFEDKTLVTDEYVQELAQKRHIPVEDVNPNDDSLLADFGSVITPVFRPIGFTTWKQTVATITGLIAKEEVVSTFGVLYNYDDSKEELRENGDQIWPRVRADFENSGAAGPAGMAFLIFNLLCAPCFAAIGAIKREMNNAKWTWAAIGWMTVWAYVLAFIEYNIGRAVTGAGIGIGTAVAAALVCGIIFLLVRPGYKEEESARTLTSVEAAAR
ncbi:MAG: ferrous iron transport protein B [Eubacterium sp.]|nr:ferrous iron transport protein B [Eubacterium sp.]